MTARWLETSWCPRRESGQQAGLLTSLGVAVIHYDQAANGPALVRWLCGGKSKGSYHFHVDRDGTTVQLTALDAIALHAGVSRLGDLRGLNRHSLGICLANLGPLWRAGGDVWFYRSGTDHLLRYDGPAPYIDAAGEGWEPYREEQLAALERLLCALGRLGHRPRLVGHDEIAQPPGRKLDPGPAFPWQRFRCTA